MSDETRLEPSEAPLADRGIETRRLQAALTSKMFGVTAAPAKAGRFVIEGHVGAGAMGTVYRARDPQLDRVVAVKVLRPRLGGTSDPEGMARLRREGQALARLSHPNVVEVLDVGEEQGQVFIAMEYVRGQTLSAWAAAQQAKSTTWFHDLRALAQEAAAGLVAAHSAGIIHRDVKPANMLVGGDGHLRLADFGLARAPRDPMADVSVEDMTTLSGSASLTGTDHGVGTPAYMAPEQFLGRVDEQSDQFAFCVSFWEVAFGARPFAGETLGELRRACEHGAITEPRGTHGIPRWFQAILRKGLASNPAKRHASMASVAAAIDAGAPSHAGRWGAGAVLVLGSVGLVGWLPEGDRALSRCADSGTNASSVWSQEQRATVVAAASEPGEGEEIAQGVDRYVAQWIQERESACEAAWTPEGKVRSKDFDVTMLCLNRQLMRVESLVGALQIDGESPPPDMAGFGRAVRNLPEPEQCRDAEAVRAEVELPLDPARAARVDTLEVELQRLLATAAVTPHVATRAAAEDLVRQAREVAHGPFLARALVRLGEAQTVDGDPAAVETFAEAAEIASRAGTYRTGVGATLSAGVVLGRMGRFEEAERFFRQGEALLPRVAARDVLASELVTSRADLLYDQGKYEEVVALLEPQVGVDEARGQEGRGALANDLERLGRALIRLGRTQEALSVLRRAVALKREVLGSEHRDVSTTLTALGTAAYENSDGVAARDAYAEALAITEALVGKKHPIYGQALGNLGSAYLLLGERDLAETAHREALAIFDEALPPTHPVRSIARVNITEFIDDDEEAERFLLEALTLAEEHLGADSVHATSARSALGELYRRTGRTEQALVALTRALEHHDAFGRERRAMGDRAELARAHVDAGDVSAARSFAARALKDARRLFPDSARVAGPLVAMAVVERAGGHSDTARTLLEEAVRLLESAEPSSDELSEAKELLGELSPPSPR